MNDAVVNAIVLTARDETRLQALEQRLSAPQRLEAVGRISSSAFHDFNNLLTVIMGSLSGIDMSGVTHDDQAAIRDATDAAARAARLTKQVLQFLRAGNATKTRLSLNDVVDGMAPIIIRLAGKHVLFESKLSDPAVMVYAELSEIEQALLNLVINAIDAMPDGGQLTVSTGTAPDLPAFNDGESAELYAWIQVQDSGMGIDRGLISRIFEPFFTTKHDTGGTGIGLYTLRRIAERYGGFVDVSSEPGVGTTFTVFLPFADAADHE
jgi:signal transduction histidine kinase